MDLMLVVLWEVHFFNPLEMYLGIGWHCGALKMDFSAFDFSAVWQR